MAGTLPNLKFNVVAEYVGKGLTAARKDISGFNKTLTKLGAAVGVAFSVQQVVQFGKASVKAFANSQREAVLLNSSLKNLGLAFASPQITNYIKEIGRLYGVTGEQAVPAMQALLSATGSVTKSQELMNTALNVSADTGIGVTEVAKGLSQAFLGNRKALTQYNTGLTKAELQTKTFDDILSIIDKRMAGEAAAAAGTFSGQMLILTENATQAKEVIGKGIIDALKTLSGDTTTADLADTMGRLADNTARSLRETAKFIKAISTPIDFATDSLLAYINKTQKYADLFFTGDPSGFFKKPNAAATKPKLIAQLSPAERRQAAAAAADAAKRASALRKIEKDRLDNLKKIAAEKAKQLALDKLSAFLNGANKLFDIDRIQLAAAAANKQTEEDRVRIRLKTEIMDLEEAIAEGNVKAAASFANMITQDAALLGQLRGDAFKFGDIPNPFTAWLITLQQLLAALGAVVTIPNTIIPPIASIVPGTTPGQTGIPGMGGIASPGYGLGGYTAPPAFSGSYNGLRLASGGIVTDPTMALIGEAGPEAVIPLGKMGGMGGTYVTVNVAGSVTSERDLIDAITQGIYNNQASGIPINYSTVY
jgi:hypothetical protein